MPVHTPGSGSDGVTVSPSPVIWLQLPGKTSLKFFVDYLASSCLNGLRRFEKDIPGEHCPHDRSILVGERHGGEASIPTKQCGRFEKKRRHRSTTQGFA
jgi:hypothetical protein